MEKARRKQILIGILKWAALALMAGFVLFGALSRGTGSRTPYPQVEEAVLTGLDMSQMTEGDNQMVRRLYGLNPSDYEGVTLYYPSTNMGTDELLLVKLRDVGQQETVKTAMESRIQSQMDVFEGYAPAEYAALEQGIIEVRGNYLLLIVSKQQESVRQAFLKVL